MDSISEPTYANMGSQIMKTTVEISDDLFTRAKNLARKEKTTFRALTETGLRLVLAGKHPAPRRRLPPLVTIRGGGLTDEFKDAGWEKIRDEIYRGRGA
jgi:hypothetical protein